MTVAPGPTPSDAPAALAAESRLVTLSVPADGDCSLVGDHTVSERRRPCHHTSHKTHVDCCHPSAASLALPGQGLSCHNRLTLAKPQELTTLSKKAICQRTGGSTPRVEIASPEVRSHRIPIRHLQDYVATTAASIDALALFDSLSSVADYPVSP